MTAINSEVKNVYLFKPKDPISALTHAMGFFASILAMPVLLTKAALYNNTLLSMISFSIYMISMIILYGASTSYHSFNINLSANKTLKKIDHCSIFLLIAGSYTPVCLISLRGMTGLILLTVIWGIAIAGIIFKIVWVTCPKWISSVIYISMGWAACSVLPQLFVNLPADGFRWLLSGGIVYTAGGVIYALKPKLFKNEAMTGFGNHELFHLFVLGGSLCHFMMMYQSLVLIG